jgi:hypothetical protein
VVCWSMSEPLLFLPHAGHARYAAIVPPQGLQAKWNRLCQRASTDIVYIGSGNNLRARIRSLVRFGVGATANHQGGEWMWQMSNVAASELVIQSCPHGKQVAFENALLDRFVDAHGDLPLANWKRAQGAERWMP